jgi:polysaccharide export outer membrane protein
MRYVPPLFRLLCLMGLFIAAPSLAQQEQPSPGPASPSQASPAAQAAPAPTGGTSQQDRDLGYILGPGDVVEVDVLGQSEFKTRARVRADGSIALPFIGNVSAQGETPTSLAQRVGASLAAGGFYNSPVVSVEIVSYASRYVIVLGAVASPGLQTVDREYRVSEIIARAGGVKDDSAEQVVLTRASGEEVKLDYVQVATGTQAQDPLVAPGDKLFVPLAETFYIYGQVNAPGAYALRDEMTLRKAIARSGGLTPNGTDKRVSVYRGAEKTKLRLDDSIMPGDVIVIGERFF